MSSAADGKQNRIVKHVFPVKDTLTEKHRGRAHVYGDDEEDCWCEPAILVWALKENGRQGWVVLREALKSQDVNPDEVSDL